jgi:MerR family mercuric resistance operon transcriptional regulator
VRIGELGRALGVSADTVRFYERAGWLPRPPRAENGYRSYRPDDVDHLRLLLDLRRIDLPLEEAARLASWCHAGHCDAASSALPSLIARRRSVLHERIDDLRRLDDRLAELEGHLAAEGGLTVIGPAVSCCSAAAAVFDTVEGGCRCCSQRVADT